MDTHVQALLKQLKTDLNSFPQGPISLEAALESASKHVPAYLKIVKGHIEQLERVLKLSTHAQRNLSTISLPEPVQQIMSLFQLLQPGDIESLELLAQEARHWETQQAIEDTTATA